VVSGDRRSPKTSGQRCSAAPGCLPPASAFEFEDGPGYFSSNAPQHHTETEI